MKRFFHEFWSLGVVLFGAAVLLCQIPYRIWFFSASEQPEVKPFASFVTFDGDTAHQLTERSLMAWQVRGKGVEIGQELYFDVLGQTQEEQAPVIEVTLPKSFVEQSIIKQNFRQSFNALYPVTQANESELPEVLLAPDEVSSQRAEREDLLELPTSLLTK